jgi:hypothetical protein
MLAEIAYIFPDTRPRDEILFPLVQLFTQTVYLAPVENDLPTALSPLAKELLAQDILHFFCPAPLGEEQKRFHSLLKDIRQGPAHYAQLALTGLGPQEAGESKNAIINAVRQGSSNTAKKHAKQEEAAALWQARLVLKLAEIIEQEEEEIQQRLHQIALREQGLLHALRDDPQTVVSSSPELQYNPSRSRLRLRAWQKLFAGKQHIVPACTFITSDQDALAAIIEAKHREPQGTVILSLPAFPAQESDVFGQRHTFRQETARFLDKLASSSFDKAMWEQLVEQYYPVAKHGRSHLTLHVFSGRATDFFAGQYEERVNDAATVLAVLRPA